MAITHHTILCGDEGYRGGAGAYHELLVVFDLGEVAAAQVFDFDRYRGRSLFHSQHPLHRLPWPLHLSLPAPFAPLRPLSPRPLSPRA